MAIEKTIQNNILRYLNSLPNCVAENVSGNISQAGRPDINCCWRGRCVRIEVKSPDHNYQPTKLQILNLKSWAKAGAYCLVAYGIDDVKAIINNEDVFYKNQFHGTWYSCEG